MRKTVGLSKRGRKTTKALYQQNIQNNSQNQKCSEISVDNELPDVNSEVIVDTTDAKRITRSTKNANNSEVVFESHKKRKSTAELFSDFDLSDLNGGEVTAEPAFQSSRSALHVSSRESTRESPLVSTPEVDRSRSRGQQLSAIFADFDVSDLNLNFDDMNAHSFKSAKEAVKGVEQAVNDNCLNSTQNDSQPELMDKSEHLIENNCCDIQTEFKESALTLTEDYFEFVLRSDYVIYGDEEMRHFSDNDNEVQNQSIAQAIGFVKCNGEPIDTKQISRIRAEKMFADIEVCLRDQIKEERNKLKISKCKDSKLRPEV